MKITVDQVVGQLYVLISSLRNVPPDQHLLPLLALVTGVVALALRNAPLPRRTSLVTYIYCIVHILNLYEDAGSGVWEVPLTVVVLLSIACGIQSFLQRTDTNEPAQEEDD